jgi:hypothetical protein
MQHGAKYGEGKLPDVAHTLETGVIKILTDILRMVSL